MPRWRCGSIASGFRRSSSFALASSILRWIGGLQRRRRGWGVCWWGCCWSVVCCCWRGGGRRGNSGGGSVRGGSWGCCGWAWSAIRLRRNHRPDGSACPPHESGYARDCFTLLTRLQRRRWPAASTSQPTNRFTPTHRGKIRAGRPTGKRSNLCRNPLYSWPRLVPDPLYGSGVFASQRVSPPCRAG